MVEGCIIVWNFHPARSLPATESQQGDRISGAEPSAYLPGDTSGYSPRLSIVARSSGSIAIKLGIVKPRTRIRCTIASYRSQPQDYWQATELE